MTIRVGKAMTTASEDKRVTVTINAPNHVNYLVDLPVKSWDDCERYLFKLTDAETLECLSFVEE